MPVSSVVRTDEAQRKAHPLRSLVVLGVVAGSILSVACQGVFGEDWDSDEGALEAGMMCTAKPVARTYAGFDGAKLEERRADENVDINKARFKPFNVMADEYKRVLGLTPRGLATAGATFNEAPERWFIETDHSGVSLSAIFQLSLDGCLQSFGSDASKAKAPTAETATAYCKETMQKAFSETPTDEQVGVCVDLATKKLTENDPKRRWAHVCATILSSSQFLTF